MAGYKIEGDNIILHDNIYIEKPCAEVFDYVADLHNDNQWRTEINNTEITGHKIMVGVLAKEHSYLSKKVPDFIYELRCIIYEENAQITFETTDNSLFYQKNTRIVQVISDKKTLLNYSIEFDAKVVKHALGFALPKWLVAYKAQSDMKKYLRNLQRVMVC